VSVFPRGETPPAFSAGSLECVAVTGHEDVVRLLLELSAAEPSKELSPLAAVRQRRLISPLTPLHWAADGAHANCVG